MIKVSTEKVYLVKDGSSQYLVEVIRSVGGRLYIALHKDVVAKYVKGDEVKEWSYDVGKAEEVEFKALPANIRRAISLNLRKL